MMEIPSDVQRISEASWRRFRSLDLLLLITGFVLTPTVIERSALLVRPPLMVQILFCIAVGTVISCPIVLASHWIFRGRKHTPSFGECLWICPLATYMFVPSFLPSLSIILFGVFIVLGTGLVAVATLFLRFAKVRTNIPCDWTDFLGCMSCILTAVQLLLDLIFHPVWI